MTSPLLTFCACIDPRRINPQTGHYPGCPDEIIPPECLLPPWEVKTTEERVYVGKGARSDRYLTGKPIYEAVTRHELVAPRASAPARPIGPTATTATGPADAPAIVLVLDTETTGLRRKDHVVGVCEIGLAVVDLSPVSPVILAKHAKLLHPGVPIPPDATRVHGIRDADVRDCQHLCDVWPALVAWVDRFARPGGQSEACVIAHNAPYDRAVLFDALTDRGIALPLHWRWFCSQQLAKRVLPGLPSYSLHDKDGKAGLATSVHLNKGEGHRAMGDVITTISLLGEMRKRAGEWGAWRGQSTNWKGEKIAEKPDQKTAPQRLASASAAPAPVAPSPSPVSPVQATSAASPAASFAARPRPRKAAPPPSMDLFARLPSTRQEPA